MKPILCALPVLAFAARAAVAQTAAVEVRAGDVFIHEARGTRRLTHDSQAGEAVLSGDRTSSPMSMKRPESTPRNATTSICAACRSRFARWLVTAWKG